MWRLIIALGVFLSSITVQAQQFVCIEEHLTMIAGRVYAEELPSGKAILKTSEQTIIWDEMKGSQGFDPDPLSFEIFRYYASNEWIASFFMEDIRSSFVLTMNATTMRVGLTINKQGLVSASVWKCDEI